MRKKVFLLILFVLLQFLQVGCWDYTEYEDMVLVTAMGIDYDKGTDKITLTIQYIPTKKQKGNASNQASNSKASSISITHSSTDKTIYDALAKIQQVVYERLFFGYLQVVVIGEEAAKYNMSDLMEFYDRSPTIRNTAFLVITPDKAETVLSIVDANFVGSSGQEIFNLINLSSFTGAAFQVPIYEFIEMLAVGGIEATAPRVISVSSKTQPEAKGGIHDNIVYDEELIGDVRVAGTAAFKGSSFVGWLDEKESMGLQWITGKNINPYKVSSPNKDDSNDFSYYRIRKSGSKIKVQIKDGNPVINVEVKVTADLRQYFEDKGAEKLSPEVISLVQKELSGSIRSDIEAALKRGQQEFESDIFGFGFAFFREYPKLWQTEYEKKWDNIFPHIPVNISIDTKIINTGTNIRRLIIK